MSTTVINSVAAARRLRDLLERKRDLFRHYLAVLEEQERDIDTDEISRLETHLAIETEVLKELEVVRRVMTPLKELGLAPAGDDVLESSISVLEEKIHEQHQKNRELLSQRTEELSNRIDALNIPLRARSVYKAPERPSMVDLVL